MGQKRKPLHKSGTMFLDHGQIDHTELITPDTNKCKQTLDISGVRSVFGPKRQNPSVPKLSVQIDVVGDRSCRTAREKPQRSDSNLSLSSIEGLGKKKFNDHERRSGVELVSITEVANLQNVSPSIANA